MQRRPDMLQMRSKFDELARDASRDGRGRLLSDLSTLVLNDRSTRENELELFFDIVRFILPVVAADHRGRFAETAADHDGVPRDVLLKLACDEIAVAAPVLSRSQGFSGPELVGLAKDGSDEHRLAIAGRPRVPGPLTEVLVQLGSRAVLFCLVGNDGAVFTEIAARELHRRAGGDEDLLQVLVTRADLGALLAGTLRGTLSRLTEAEAPKVRKITPPAPPARPENPGVAHLLGELRQGKRKLAEIVSELTTADRHADLARFLGDVASIDESQILRVLVRADANGIATVARGMGLDSETYGRIVEMRRRKLKFSTSQVRWEREHFDRLDLAEAKSTLSGFVDRRKRG